jgi:PAS domain S-box-containing protein
MITLDEPSFDDALKALTEAALSLLEADAAGVTVWDETATRGIIRAAAGTVVDHVGEELGEGSAGQEAARTGLPVIRSHPEVPSATPELKEKLKGFASGVGVPLLAGDTRITFQVGWSEPQSLLRLERSVDVLGTLGRLTQIAQRAEVERLRSVQEARLEAVFDCVGEGLLLDTPEGSQLNAAARRLLAVENDELPPDFVPKDLDGRSLEPDEYPSARAHAAGKPVDFRIWGRRADGVERIYGGTAAPITRDGDDLGTVLTFRDVTDEHTQRVLTERFLEQLFSALPVAVAVTHPTNGEIASVNPAFAQILGYEVDDVVGTAPPYTWWADSVATEELDEEQRPFEALFRRADGRPVPVEVTPITIREPSGTAAAKVLLIGDLSDRRRFEAQIVQSGKLAAIGELAAGVAHEINNPLFAILGLVEFLLKDAEPGTRQRERLELIQQTGLEIKEVVRALLDFAREPSGEFEVVSLHDVLAASVDLVRRTSLRKGIELVESYAPEPLYANASSGQLKQILLNLVTNAQQAIGDVGTLRIELAREGDDALVTVTDSGPGIPDEVLARIFDPFFTTKRELGGTGLGLALSLSIAQDHGGQLTAANGPEGGAQFVLRLPLVEATG